MRQPWCADIAFRKALNLVERKEQGGTSAGGAGNPKHLDDLLARWTDAHLGGNPLLLTQFLTCLGVDRSQVGQLLQACRDSPACPAGPAPGWYDTFSEVFSPATAGGEPVARPGLSSDGFALAFRPFLTWARERLRSAVARFSGAPAAPGLDPERFLATALTQLLDALTDVAVPAMTCRLEAAKRAGTLSGRSPRERFRAFVRSELADPDDFRAVLTDFPVLARLLSSATARAAAGWDEFLLRLATDWPRLCAAFRTCPTDRLVEVEPSLGDPHDGGRRVMVLHLESGHRLVYKPRPLSIDVHFQGLLAWFNERGLRPHLRTAGVLDAGAHGWAEYVHHPPCQDREQLEAFYQRLGSLLFLAHLLYGTDLHFQNLIACGEHPVLVDLEALFHNWPGTRGTALTQTVIRESLGTRLVIRTGLLPNLFGGPAGDAEFSGAAGRGGRPTPFLVPRWGSPNTDDMRIVMRRTRMPRTHNLPRKGGRSANPGRYRGHVVKGFIRTYELAARHRQELLEEGGPILQFRDDWVRYVPRGTQQYLLLLHDSYHPSCLRDAAERDFLFGSLMKDVESRPYLRALIRSEMADLWNGDVPLFRARVGGNDLFDCRGVRIPRFFEQSALERVVGRVRQLDEADLERQAYCIDRSLGPRPAPG
jgi:type 2 lantibiotic biosynthesis protein LanM